MMWKASLCVALALTAAAVPAAVAAPDANKPPEGATDITWYTMLAQDGVAFGAGYRALVPRAAGRDIIDEQTVDIREEGDKWTRMFARTVVTQDASGATRTLTVVNEAARMWSRITARIDGDVAQVTRETPTDRRTMTVALPPRVQFDTGDQALLTWNPTTTPRLEFDNFDIDAMQVEHVVIEVAPGTWPDAQGRTAVIRKRYMGQELRSIVKLWLDRARNVVEVTQPLFGTQVTVKATDRETALRPHPPYRIMRTVATKSPFLITQSAIDGHIRYRFTFRDGVQFALPQTGEQRVRMEGGEAIVDICDGCGPGVRNDEAGLADPLAPAMWLQSDDPKIRDLAAPVAAMNTSQAHKMELLLQKTQKLLPKIDFAGHYSAMEAIRRRAGDCSENAVLLAALGRAAGIPTRVANGLVYSRYKYHGVSNAFLPHSWTLAYVDGKWRSYDAALNGFDATHIVLTVSDGDAKSLLATSQLGSLLKWESLVEVRSRPAT